MGVPPNHPFLVAFHWENSMTVGIHRDVIWCNTMIYGILYHLSPCYGGIWWWFNGETPWDLMRIVNDPNGGWLMMGRWCLLGLP
jgi:hypothetical protein